MAVVHKFYVSVPLPSNGDIFSLTRRADAIAALAAAVRAEFPDAEIDYDTYEE